jgi:REP element-mobilizing transposase RayT
VTRRCSERRFFLRPGRAVNEIFLYVLAVAAARHGVLVHAFCVLSNHCHLVVTDVEGRLPAFMQYLDSLVARAVNASLGRFEGFWASDGSYSAVEPIEQVDVVSKCAYVLANPVAAGLVRTGAEWPGLWTAPERMGTAPVSAKRPKVFFDPNGHMPESAVLHLTAPPGFSSHEAFRSQVAAALRDLEEKHQRAFAAEGTRFLGATRVLAQSPFSRPASGEQRFRLSPRVAARDKRRRIEALQRVRAFLQRYREAYAARRAGDMSVVFPAGTYLLRIMHGVQVEGGLRLAGAT